jgi:hypothetical protein
VSELITRMRDTFAELAASDPQCKRFGAARHRYLIRPPLTHDQLAAVEAQVGELPDEYRDYVSRLSAGGVGPYYGILRADRPCVVEAPPGVTTWRRALAVSHMGCGYAAALVLDGNARGQIWIYAPAPGVVEPIRTGFTACLLDWIDRLSAGRWLDGFVPIERCPAVAGVTGYLTYWEKKLGIPDGSIAGNDLRTALTKLSGIELAGGPPLFADGDRVDPCVSCARWLNGLVVQGLDPSVVASGVTPLPDR